MGITKYSMPRVKHRLEVKRRKLLFSKSNNIYSYKKWRRKSPQESIDMLWL